jgi:alpha-beta hydrolase superfamily lysophospholipase
LPRTRQLTAPSGIELVADVWDRPSGGVPVLLLHGMGQTRHSWRRTAERLESSGVQAVAVDLRGHGDSILGP